MSEDTDTPEIPDCTCQDEQDAKHCFIHPLANRPHVYLGTGDACRVGGCGRMPRALIHQAFFR